MPEKLNLSVREAAALLGISAPHLRTHLLHRPDFPAYQIGERWVIPREELEEWNHDQVRKKKAAAPAV